jgi:methyl-accepting chemotaxis protein WspA
MSATAVRRHRGLGRTLAFALSAMAIGPLAFLAAFLWVTTGRAIERSATETLKALADEKASRIEMFVEARLRSVIGAANDHAFLAAARGELTDDDLTHMRLFAEAMGYPEVLVADAGGTITFALEDAEWIGKSTSDADLAAIGVSAVATRVRATMQAELTPPLSSAGGTSLAIYAVGPLIDDGTIVGLCAARLPTEELNEVVSDYTGLGSTGDVVGAADIGGAILMTTPGRGTSGAGSVGRALRQSGTEMARLRAACAGVASSGYCTDADGQPVIGAWTYVPSLRWGLGATMRVEEAFALAASQRNVIIAVLSIFGIASVVIARLLARSISGPIEHAAQVGAALADGDLTRDVTPSGSGEPRALLEAMQRAVSGLRTLVGGIRASVAESLGAATRIRAIAQEQQGTVTGFDASATQIAAAVHEIAATGRQLAATVESVARTATDAAHAAEQGHGSLHELGDSIRDLQEASAGVAGRLEAIRCKTESITGIVTTITRVAEQTNLLSINASIEAERAGAHGVGFRVVAREVARLAAQTAAATVDIERLVSGMQSAVHEGVREMSRFAQSVQRGTETSAQASGRLGEVIGQVGGLQSRFAEVAESVQAQDAGARQISEAMSTLASGARSAAEAVRKFTEASASLETQARELERSVASFKLAAH